MDQTIYLTVKCAVYISAVGLLQGDDWPETNNVKDRNRWVYLRRGNSGRLYNASPMVYTSAATNSLGQLGWSHLNHSVDIGTTGRTIEMLMKLSDRRGSSLLYPRFHMPQNLCWIWPH
jgi:hypothetical protein